MLKDGEYLIDVSLEGGSGKASITSPTMISVQNGKCMAEIEWSSPNYDYMKIGVDEYYPISNDGTSLFWIEVPKLDADIHIKAETVAMSEPHLIDYTIHFDSSTAKSGDSGGFIVAAVCVGAVAVIAAVTAIIARRKKKANVTN